MTKRNGIVDFIRDQLSSKQQPFVEGDDDNQNQSLLIEDTMPTRISNEGRKCYIEGIFARGGNFVNKNGRNYPNHVLQESFDGIQEKIRNGEILGELSHSNGQSVDLTRASHVVKSLSPKGDDWYGRAEVLKGGQGKVLSALLGAGAAVGISQKGFGSVVKQKNGILEVTSPYSLVSFDAVSQPSNQKFLSVVSTVVGTVWMASVAQNRKMWGVAFREGEQVARFAAVVRLDVLPRPEAAQAALMFSFFCSAITGG
jgi:hypothetical protein